MNSMELVHHVATGASPWLVTERRSAPLFRTELAGPVRIAILRARQFLLSEQRGDGLWLGRQAADASLPSLLVFWLAFTEHEHGELAQQSAAKILELQRPAGGWSRSPDRAMDVSTSVQAYLALKLVGIDPSCERLALARAEIRRHGGADAADATTRFILAQFGQIGYDACPEVLPEELLFNANSVLRGPLSIVWSHRPVCEVEIDRGVRELFIRQPRDWPALRGTPGHGRMAGIARSLGLVMAQTKERRSRTPLRRRAIRRVKAELIGRVASDRIGELRFDELIWHLVALRALGFDFESPEIQACEYRLEEMIHIDEDANTALPQCTSNPIADSALVVRTLLESGLPMNHGAIARALDGRCSAAAGWMPSSPTTADLCGILSTVPTTTESAGDCGLPPGIEVCWDWPDNDGSKSASTHDIAEVAPLMRDTFKRLLSRQNADGGWSECSTGRTQTCASAPDITGRALEALSSTDTLEARSARARAVAHLRATQGADGSWMGETAATQIQATSWTLRGLLSAGVPVDDGAIAGGANWLVVHQQPAGGWSNSTSSDNASAGDGASATPTAWALLALVAAGKASHVAARRAVEFLIDAQDDDGRWTDSGSFNWDAVAKRWFVNDLHSVAWPLQALSRWAVAAISAQSAAAGETSLRLVGAAVVD